MHSDITGKGLEMTIMRFRIHADTLDQRFLEKQELKGVD